MSNEKNKYKGIEKYIDVSKLDINELTDYDDAEKGQVLVINDEGEPEWSKVNLDSSIVGDLNIKLGIFEDTIQATISKVEKIETEYGLVIKEKLSGIIIEQDRINEIVAELNKTVSDNADIFDKYKDELEGITADIYQLIESNLSYIDILNKEMELQVEESIIKGAYVAGSNEIPTSTWHNQVSPNNNATLNNFLFEQDSGWIGSSNNDHRLMFGGRQSLSINNPLKNNGEFTTFNVEAWFKPYYAKECTLMDFIYLYDEGNNIRIRTENIDIRTTACIQEDALNHISVNVNMQSQQFRIFLNGEEVKLLQTINTNTMVLPDVLTLFDNFEGEVYSFKFYRRPLIKDYIIRNYEQGVDGDTYVMFYLDILLEADKAETVWNKTVKLQSSIDILKNAINLSVSKEEYNKDKEGITSRLDKAEIALKPESITQTVLNTTVDINGESKTIYTQITQNAKEITSVANEINGPNSKLNQTINNILAEVNGVSKTIDGIVVGNKNLLRNALYFKDSSFWEGNIDVDAENKILKCHGKVKNITPIQLEAGKTYIFSAYIKSDKTLVENDVFPLDIETYRLESSALISKTSAYGVNLEESRYTYRLLNDNSPVVINVGLCCGEEIICSDDLILNTEQDDNEKEFPNLVVEHDVYHVSRGENILLNFTSNNRNIEEVKLSIDSGVNYDIQTSINGNEISIDTNDLKGNSFTCRLKAKFKISEDNYIYSVSNLFNVVIEDVATLDNVFEEKTIIRYEEINNENYALTGLLLKTTKDLQNGYSINCCITNHSNDQRFYIKSCQLENSTVITEHQLSQADVSADMLQKASAYFNIEADRIKQSVSKKVGSSVFNSFRDQTAEAFTDTITRNEFESQKKQTADEISSKVSNIEFSSFKKQTADEISSKVSNGEYESFKKQTADEIANTVTSADVQTIVTHNASSWGLSINGKLQGVNYLFNEQGFHLGGTANGFSVDHTNEYSRWKHENGEYSQVDWRGFGRYKPDGTIKQYMYSNYIATHQRVRNGTTHKFQLPDEFKNKIMDRDFRVFGIPGAIDSDSYAKWQQDAVRNIFIKIVNFNSATAELTVMPCLQKIGLKTLYHWGWDEATTSKGATAREGCVDIVIVATM